MKKYGYDDLTIEQITKSAHVSVGTFYHYFNSKFALLAEIYGHGDQYFLENVASLCKQYQSCIQRVKAYFGLYADLCLQNGIEMTSRLYVPENKMFMKHGRAMQELLTRILREGQEKSEITKKLPAESITEQLFVVGRGVAFDWCLNDGKTDVQEQMQALIGRFIESFTSEK